MLLIHNGVKYINMEKRVISMKKKHYQVNFLIFRHPCYRCGHAWVPRDISEVSEICPKCKSPYWKKPKTRFNKGEKRNGK